MAFKKKSHEEEFELFLQSVELFTKESVGLFLSRRPRGSRMPSRSSRLVMPHEDRIGRTRKVWTRNLLEHDLKKNLLKEHGLKTIRLMP